MAKHKRVSLKSPKKVNDDAHGHRRETESPSTITLGKRNGSRGRQKGGAKWQLTGQPTFASEMKGNGVGTRR